MKNCKSSFRKVSAATIAAVLGALMLSVNALASNENSYYISHNICDDSVMLVNDSESVYVEDMEIITYPDNLKVSIGTSYENVDYTGLTVRLKYSDGTTGVWKYNGNIEENINGHTLEISGPDSISIGENTICIYCDGFGFDLASFDLTVEEQPSKWEYKIVDENSIEIVGCEVNEYALTVPETIDGKKITRIEDSALAGSGITSVEIPDSVTYIGKGVFSYCRDLTYVKLPETLDCIQDETFIECSKLNSITIPKSVKKIGEGAFSKSGLKGSLNIPEGVTTIGEAAFYYTAVNVFIPSTVEYIGDDAFLTPFISQTSIEVDANNKYYSSYEGVLYNKDKTALIRCPASLKEITIPDSVERIEGDAFMCGSIRSIEIPDSVKYIGASAFAYCTSLEKIVIPESVTKLCDPFYFNSPTLTIYGEAGSAAEQYAKENDILFIEISSFSDCELSLSADSYVYDGKEKTPSVTVKDGTKTLVEGTDYKITYKNNTAIGTAEVIITGIGTYSGTVTKEFKIVPAAPVLTSLSNTASGTTVSWNTVTGATGYILYRKTGNGSWSRVADIKNGTITSYTDKTVKSGTTYTYTVRAYSGNTVGDWKSTKTIKYLATPTVSSAANITSGVQVKWTKVTGASGYYVYRKTGKGSWNRIANIKSGTTTSYTDKTAKSGTTYTYTVRAYSGSYISSYNAAGKTVKRLTTPTLGTVSNTASGITVKWTKVTGASGYYVYRKSGNGSWTRLATVKSGSTLNYNDTKAVNGTVYTYTVRAYSGSYASSYNATGKTIARLTRPSISSVTNQTGRKITVKWNRNTKATGYQIYYRTGSTVKIVTVSGNANVSNVISSLTKGKTYTVYVRSYKKSGSVAYYSAWSAAKSVKITK